MSCIWGGSSGRLKSGEFPKVQSDGYGFLCMSPGLEAAGSDTDILPVTGILGESVTFPLNIQQPQQVINIAWNSETSVAFVTPGDPGTAPKVTVTHQHYNDRINVSRQNYNLEISNLGVEDSGIYRADINLKMAETTVTTTRRYNLQVYRKLQEPRGLVLFCKFASFLTIGFPKSFCPCTCLYKHINANKEEVPFLVSSHGIFNQRCVPWA